MPRSQISDQLWKRIERHVCGKPQDRGVTGRDNRRFVEAVVWICRTGAPWRDLPSYFGKWSTVYRRFRRWALAGVWRRIAAAVVERRRRGQESAAGPARAMLDSTAVRVHQHGAPPRGRREEEAVGKSRAGWTCKLHAAVDRHGMAWATRFTGGQRADIDQAAALLRACPPRARVIADKAYDADRFVETIAARGGRAVIPARRGRRVVRRLDRTAYRERNVVERAFARLKQWRRVATRDERSLASFSAIVACAEIVMHGR